MLELGLALAAAASGTDFGVRELDSLPSTSTARPSVSVHPIFAAHPSYGADLSSRARAVNISAIAAMGSAWGRVTSTYRSPQHNRRVGGVHNSFHLRGRAIDIARRSGVSHSAIAAAYRSAGYYLVESLDEGDHSHFAFGSPGQRAANNLGAPVTTGRSASGTQWKMVSAPR